MPAICVHATPGRLRFRSPSVKNNKLRAQALRSILGDCQGVQAVAVNPLTGSILVEFDPGQSTADTLLHTLRSLESAPVSAACGKRPGTRRNFHATIAKPLAQMVGRRAVEHLVERLLIVLFMAVAI